MNNTAIKIDQGPRENIEDSACHLTVEFNCPDRKKATLLAVADGVGGNNFGEIASRETIQFLCLLLIAELHRLEDFDNADMKAVIKKILISINKRILEKGRSDPALEGMSTTIVLCVIIDNIAYIGWAGDSRCYVYSKGELCQVTTDHSVTEELVSQGLLDPKYAKDSPFSHTITQYIANPQDFKPGIIEVFLKDGDTLLLCSDGLTDVMCDERIKQELKNLSSPKQICDNLVRSALDSNTTDNVTAIVHKHCSDTKTNSTTAYLESLNKLFTTSN